ncbi:MAG: SH3 domain-containing protein [Bacteroidota bacterium]
MIVLLALLLLGPPRAEDRPEAERLFQLGLELVAEGDTTGALAAWNGAAATEWTSAALSYNRGLIALQRGNLGTARLALERAARLDPRNTTISSALADVRAQSGDAPPSAIDRIVQGALSRIGPFGAVVLALAMYGLVLSLGALWWRRRTRPLALGVLASALGFSLALGLATFGLMEASMARGVVLDTGVLRTAPSPTATEAARLPAGTALQLGETQGAWQAVTVDDLDGWIPILQVEAI